MQTTLDVVDQTTLTFYWKVSSEQSFDYLQFYIDGVLKDQISGVVDWQQKSYNITGTGSHTLKWRYVKDSSDSSGSDCGWVDWLQYTKPAVPDPVPTTWQSITYKYDPAGRRIEKIIDGKYKVKYCYDGDHVIAEYDGSGFLLRKYIYGPLFYPPSQSLLRRSSFGY